MTTCSYWPKLPPFSLWLAGLKWSKSSEDDNGKAIFTIGWKAAAADDASWFYMKKNFCSWLKTKGAFTLQFYPTVLFLLACSDGQHSGGHFEWLWSYFGKPFYSWLWNLGWGRAEEQGEVLLLHTAVYLHFISASCIFRVSLQVVLDFASHFSRSH